MSTRTCFRLPARRALARCALAVLLTGGILAVCTATQASAATNDIYIANLRGDSVSVVDPTTNAVVTTVPVGTAPGGVAVTPDDSAAWVVNGDDNTVSVISTATNAVTATIPVDQFPSVIAFSPDGYYAYIGLFFDRGTPGSGGVEVIDTSTDAMLALVQPGIDSSSIAVSPDGSRVYVTDPDDGSVSVIDTETDTVTATISGMSTPEGIAISPDGTSAYVTDFGDNEVDVIDTATNTVTATIPVAGPWGISLTPDGSSAYVTSPNANTVAEIDTGRDTVAATVPAGNDPIADLVTSDGSTVYVANRGDDTVSAINTVGNTVTGTIAVGAQPFALAQAVVRPPVIGGMRPSDGPLTGGTTVTIRGTRFTGATAVSFGRTPATSFTVNSDTSITATVPPATAIGTVDVTVTTPAGTSAAVAADQYSYIYPFDGFLAPVANPPATNTENAGRVVPVQFSLGGNEGLGVLAPGYPAVQQVACGFRGRPIGYSSSAAAAGNSGLQYDAGTGTYTFAWKTASAYAGTCQEFTLELNDGTFYTANFSFS